MKQIVEKVKELKTKALGILETKLNENPTVEDVQVICTCLNSIEEDKNWYYKLIERFPNNGFFASSNTTETNKEEIEIVEL